MSTIAGEESEDFVSTGHLPVPYVVERLVHESHERFRTDTEGVISNVYPALEKVQPDLFGVCLVGPNGNVYAAGDIDHPFTIMSIAQGQ